jgi:hypothetical protein
MLQRGTEGSEQTPVRRRSVSNRLHGMTFRKTVTFKLVSVKIWNITGYYDRLHRPIYTEVRPIFLCKSTVPGRRRERAWTHNLGGRYRWVISIMTRPSLTPRQNPDTLWKGDFAKLKSRTERNIIWKLDITFYFAFCKKKKVYIEGCCSQFNPFRAVCIKKTPSSGSLNGDVYLLLLKSHKKEKRDTSPAVTF